MAAPLPKSVKSLGLVSLLTDASSEMIYPLLPSFLSGVLKAGPAFLGLVEGAAEAVASLLKLLAGRLSDRAPRRKPFVVWGYGLSTLARPLVALATAPWHVLAVRLADRAGKGVRGAPRDAILAAVTPAAERGRVYGFHRAMDHAGAMVGPLLASAALLLTSDLRIVFGLALAPGLLALVVLVLGVEEPQRAPAPSPEGPQRLPHDTGSTGSADRRALRRYLAVVGLFTLGNSSDAFLLLRAQEAGVGLVLIPVLWTFHHLVKAATSTFGGRLSDRAGRKSTILLGWGIYALSYLGFALVSGPAAVFALFGVYGLFHAFTEGPEKALVADLAPAGARGAAFGLYHAVTGAALLPASLLTGGLWERFGPAAALGTGAALAGLAALALSLLVREPRPAP